MFDKATVRSTAVVSLVCGWLVTTVAPGAIVGTGLDYTISLSDGGRVAVMEIQHAEYENWADGIGSSEMRSMTNRVYNHFKDDFDFILFSSNEASVRSGAYAGIYSAAQNNTTGIGSSIFNNTASYGSGGKLQGAIHLTWTGLRSGPSLHEIAHRWAQFLSEIDPGTPVGPHWGFAGVGGQLGGFEPGTLTDLGGGLFDANGPRGTSSFGTIANGGNALDYGALELYLMGLINVNEFKTLHGAGGNIQLPVNPVITDSSAGQFTADSINVVNIDDIIASKGSRSPGQTSFKSLLVLLTDKDNPIGEAGIDAFDAEAELFGRNSSDASSLFNFWEATGGRATMNVGDLSQSVVPEPGTAFLALGAVVLLAVGRRPCRGA